MTQENEHQLMEAYRLAGGMPDAFQGKEMAYLMIHGNKIFRSNPIEGLEMECFETKHGVDVYFKMKKGYKFDKPVNICFGLVPKEGKQEIYVEGTIEDDARLEFLAYCVFPNALKIEHIMRGNVKIGNNSSFKYNEVHYHGNEGGIKVVPKLMVILEKNSSYEGNFYLVKGRAGQIDICYNTVVGENSRAKMTAKIFASKDDIVNIKEKLFLKDRDAKGTISSRTVGMGDSKVDIINEITALEAGCVGHIDCIETILDNSTAKATPLVDVRNKKARVTHEAAIGSLNSKQLETIMSKGLTEEEAIDVLVKGFLK